MQVLESRTTILQEKFKPITWHLPRPNPTHYKGSVPLHFEHKFLQFTGINNDQRLLNMFSGGSKMGYTVDIKPEVKPNFIADCHFLPFENNEFDNVFLDPPYSDEESESLYGTGPLSPSKYIKEAVRVCKPNGLIACYHIYWTPRPEGCKYLGIIVIITRVYHKPRVCTIFKKESALHSSESGVEK